MSLYDAVEADDYISVSTAVAELSLFSSAQLSDPEKLTLDCLALSTVSLVVVLVEFLI